MSRNTTELRVGEPLGLNEAATRHHNDLVEAGRLNCEHPSCLEEIDGEKIHRVNEMVPAATGRSGSHAEGGGV